MIKGIWNYYGLFIIDEYRNQLINFIKERYSKLLPNYIKDYVLDNIKNDNIILTHLTLLHYSDMQPNNANINYPIYNFVNDLLLIENLEIPILITHIGYSNKAVAFKCIAPIFKNKIMCANKMPHITICTIGEGKSVDSNNITNWIKINSLPINTIIKLVKN